MLGGPVGTGDYFDPSIRGSFPTPNESSLRTGLTPGGGGSMFPAPSPSSQALFQQLQSGGATPSTLDFHRTAMNAAAAQKTIQPGVNGTTSQTVNKRAPIGSMDNSTQQQGQNQAFGENQQHNDAANGLFLLAQAGTDQTNNQFAIPNPPTSMVQNNNQGRVQETSPSIPKRHGRNANGSIGGSLSGSARGQSELSGEQSDNAEQVMPTARTRSKRTSTGKGAATGNGRRKAEETPSKQPPAKKSKTSNGNNGMNLDMTMDGMESDEEQEQMNIKEEQYHENGKKMTDEEKRKNFLERNRYVCVTSASKLLFQLTSNSVAALKCRQRKKQWLANLQAKVEIFTSENDGLSAQVASLREEIVGLKTILLQHKDCPVSQSQGLGQYFQQQHDYNPHANPYGMAMANGQQVMAGQRRYLPDFPSILT